MVWQPFSKPSSAENESHRANQSTQPKKLRRIKSVMTQSALFQLNQISVIDVTGQDANKIVHNLTTQAIQDLDDLESVESFITDVKGKMVGHVIVMKNGENLRLVGPSGQSSAIAAHIDRYIIREDADVSVVDDNFSALIAGKTLGARIDEQTRLPAAETTNESRMKPCSVSTTMAGQPVWITPIPWLGLGSKLILIKHSESSDITNELVGVHNCVLRSEEDFHRERTRIGFPWFGIDLNSSNLPQEADRDSETISFTKGCYLGQETIARLDAMGQVQKKLVRWKLEGDMPSIGSTVDFNDKVVGRLTSVAEFEDGIFAIGPARRSHFEPGSVGDVTDDADQSGKTTATVL